MRLSITRNRVTIGLIFDAIALAPKSVRWLAYTSPKAYFEIDLDSLHLQRGGTSPAQP